MMITWVDKKVEVEYEMEQNYREVKFLSFGIGWQGGGDHEYLSET